MKLFKCVVCSCRTSSRPQKGPGGEFPVCADCVDELEEREREEYRRLGLAL
jgi:hypothetical protein